jgi:hypothetical protein
MWMSFHLCPHKHGSNFSHNLCSTTLHTARDLITQQKVLALSVPAVLNYKIHCAWSFSNLMEIAVWEAACTCPVSQLKLHCCNFGTVVARYGHILGRPLFMVVFGWTEITLLKWMRKEYNKWSQWHLALKLGKIPMIEPGIEPWTS